IVVAFVCIGVTSANKSNNVFGIECNRVVVVGDGFIIIAGIGICIALADQGSVARLRLAFSAFARLLLSPESSDWWLLSFPTLTLVLRVGRRSRLALLLRCQPLL